MPMPVPTARHVATFLFCVICIQLIVRFHEPIREVFLHPSRLTNDDQSSHRIDHPTVPLDIPQLAILDKLAESIVNVEAHRTFAESGLNDIHGSSILNDPEQVKKIRDQIHCWTKHGSWVRDIEGNTKTKPAQWPARQHLGYQTFSQCDARFTSGLNKLAQEGQGDYHLGEYDQKNGRWIVREAVKYRWVPDETICGPKPLQPSTKDEETTTPLGLGDDRSKYQPFHAEDFCEILKDRNLIIAGDITQYQLHDSILSAAGIPFVSHGELDCLDSLPHPLCPSNSSYLKYARNDFVSVPWALNRGDDDFPSGATVEQQWATYDLMLKYKVVLLNKGLVWKSDNEFLTELVFTMKHLWRYYPGTMIIYRATHQISNCTVLKEQGEDEALATPDGLSSIVPGTTIQKPLTQAPERSGEKEDVLGMHRPTMADIARQNKMAKVIVEAAGGIFLDTEEMFAKRPDGRMGDGDCTRFCAPGPIDAYADLIYNTLRILPRDTNPADDVNKNLP
ncbi:hypothetical protein BGX21_009461 [Mortierella sp. AD011]|nr:hypothetical protein BGX20_008252 [Mortierella sp. AD010]KAF9396659.1 hypothetical protein BGX21_009461 [Mortierella sp. AD011]